jgi:hypothetical protein
MTVSQQRYIYILAVCLIVFLTKSGGLPSTLTKVDRVTYVYDLEEDVISAYVRAAMRDVGRSGIMAEFLDLHPDVVQERDRPALEAAKAGTTPCLVVQSGDTVKQVIDNPTPEQIKGFIP